MATVSKLYLSLTFFMKTPSALPYKPPPSYSPKLYNPDNILQAVKILQRPFTSFSQAQILLLSTLSPCSSLYHYS